jgi:hypothetical protein
MCIKTLEKKNMVFENALNIQLSSKRLPKLNQKKRLIPVQQLPVSLL